MKQWCPCPGCFGCTHPPQWDCVNRDAESCHCRTSGLQSLGDDELKARIEEIQLELARRCDFRKWHESVDAVLAQEEKPDG